MRIFDPITGEAFERRSINTKTEKHRGENQKAFNRSQIAKSNAGLEAAGGYGAAAGSELGAVMAPLQGIIANPMSGAERAGVLSAAGGAYDAASEKAGERQARTRNSAGYGELLDELARGKARTMGTTAASLGDTEYNRKMQALKAMQGLYGTNVQAQTNLLRPNQPVQEPGFWDQFVLTAMGNANRAASGLAGG